MIGAGAGGCAGAVCGGRAAAGAAGLHGVSPAGGVRGVRRPRGGQAPPRATEPRLRAGIGDDKVYTSPSTPSARCRRSEEHTSELQSLMRISYAVFCLKKKKKDDRKQPHKNKE